MAHLGDRVAAYVDGQLPADEAERADAHLQECQDCREAVTAQRTLKRRMTSLGATPHLSASLLSALSDPARLAGAAPPSRLQSLFEHALARGVIAASGASAVLAGLAYVVGAPTQPIDTVAPPVERFVAQFRGAADPVQQSVRVAGAPSAEVSLAVAPGRAIARTKDDEPQAVALLQSALGSAVSVRLLANRYDLSVVHPRAGRSDVVVAADGHRVARYVLDDHSGALRQVVRYVQPSATDPVSRAIRTITGDGVSRASTSTPVRRTTSSASVQPAATEAIDGSVMDRLTAQGFPCHDRLGSGLERVSAQWVELSGERAVALTYSDGESTLTLYEQNGTLSRESVSDFRPNIVAGTRVWVRSGDPSVATWDADGVVFTVVTNGPPERLRDAVAELPGEARADGLLDRVRRGLARLSDWASPVGGDS